MCRTLIYIGGDYREETQKIIEKYDNQTSLAALVYEQKIHSGLEQNYDRIFNLLVAMVSWFPKRSRLFINKTVKIDNGYSVGFNNLIGVRDYSIYFSLKKYFKKIIKQNKLKNEPFDVFFTTQNFYNAKLGKYIKKKYPAARIVYDIQDGPGLISKKYKGLTKALKNYQQKTLIKNMTGSADGYVVMTPYMTELFDSKNAEVLVIEGVTEKNDIDRPVVPQVITYTGGIYKTVASFPESGDVNTLYVNTANGQVCYWDGTQYVTVVKATGQTISGAGDNNTLATTKAVVDYVAAQIAGQDIGSLVTRIETAEGEIDTLQGQMTVVQGEGEGSIKKALSDAKAYADSLAPNYAAAEHTHEMDDVTGLNDALTAKADKATTLAGYGITDAYTQTQTDTKIAEAIAVCYGHY